MLTGDNSSSDIQKAFTAVFSDIDALVDGQISKATEKELSVKVSSHALITRRPRDGFTILILDRGSFSLGGSARAVISTSIWRRGTEQKKSR